MGNLKEELKGKLTEEELALLKRSFDTVGNVIIIEIPEGLEAKEKLIAETLLQMHKNIKTVLKKVGVHSGKYRRQKLKVIGGEKSKEATYRENGVVLKLGVEKVYFSPRSSTERKRISDQVCDGEKILVMFSGCGPFPLVISKNAKPAAIYGIELNPIAHKYAVENVLINKAKTVILIKGDVRKEVPKLLKQAECKSGFDRISMPLPKGAEKFLDVALSASKKGTIIHFYDFAKEEEIPAVLAEKVEKACKKAKKEYEILKIVKCGDFGPRIYRVCVDFEIK